MHTLYFTRHGETVWNVENKICGMTDSPLTERGRQQARKLGEAVKASGVHIDEILYSPLSRAADTAKAIATASATRIMDGEADVFPTESACTYCPYGAVCRFEKQGGRTRTCRKVKFEELLDKGDEQDGMD